MVGDLHVETVVTPAGRVRVYLSDLRRQPLPVDDVTGSVTLQLAEGKQTLSLTPADDALVAHGAPLAADAVGVRVALVRDGRAIELHPVVGVGIRAGLVGIPRVCGPPLGPAPRDTVLPWCVVQFGRMVRAVASTPDDGLLLIAVFGHGVSIWGLPAAEAVGAFEPMPGGDDPEHVHPVDALAVRADGLEAAVTVRHGVLRYGLPDGRLVKGFARDHRTVPTLGYVADGTRLVRSTLVTGELETVSVEDGRVLGRLGDRPLAAVGLSPGAESAVLASETGTLSIVAPSVGIPVRVLTESFAIATLAVGDAGLIAGGDDGTIVMWEPAGEREVFRTSVGTPVMALAVRAGGRMLAGGGHDGSIRLLAVPEGRVVETLSWHTSPVQALAWAGRFLVSGDASGGLALWDVAEKDFTNAKPPT